MHISDEGCEVLVQSLVSIKLYSENELPFLKEAVAALNTIIMLHQDEKSGIIPFSMNKLAAMIAVRDPDGTVESRINNLIVLFERLKKLQFMNLTARQGIFGYLCILGVERQDLDEDTILYALVNPMVALLSTEENWVVGRLSV